MGRHAHDPLPVQLELVFTEGCPTELSPGSVPAAAAGVLAEIVRDYRDRHGRAAEAGRAGRLV